LGSVKGSEVKETETSDGFHEVLTVLTLAHRRLTCLTKTNSGLKYDRIKFLRCLKICVKNLKFEVLMAYYEV
jgi:hypothetical protein